MPPSVAARRCHSRSVVAWRRAQLELQVLDRQVGGADDDERADEDDDEVDAVRRAASAPSSRGSHRGSLTPNRVERERDAGERGDAVGEQRQRAHQLPRARVNGRAVLGADDVERAEQRGG